MKPEQIKQHGEVFQIMWEFWKDQEPEDGGMVSWIRWKMREPRPIPNLLAGMEDMLTPRSVADADQLREEQVSQKKFTKEQLVPGAIVHGPRDLPSCKIVSIKGEFVEVLVIADGKEMRRHAPTMVGVLLGWATEIVPPEPQ